MKYQDGSYYSIISDPVNRNRLKATTFIILMVGFAILEVLVIQSISRYVGIISVCICGVIIAGIISVFMFSLLEHGVLKPEVTE
jgi:hypothetical protein